MRRVQLDGESSDHRAQHRLELHLGEARADAVARPDAERHVRRGPRRLAPVEEPAFPTYTSA